MGIGLCVVPVGTKDQLGHHFLGTILSFGFGDRDLSHANSMRLAAGKSKIHLALSLL